MADLNPEAAIVAAIRRAADRPEYRIEKRPALRNRQGMWALIGEDGAVLKRGHDLGRSSRRSNGGCSSW